MGASIAFHLAQRGADVLLLERRHLCAGSTRHSTAIVRLHYTQPLLVRMAARGLDVYRTFEDRYGTSAGFVHCGMLFGVAEAESDTLAANVEVGLAEGANTALVSAEEVREIDGRVNPDGLAFCYEPEAGYCDPYLATGGFAAAAVRSGARIEERRSALWVDGAGVETKAGRIEADAVVVAAGPWTPALLAPVGYRLPIAPAPAEVGRYRLRDAFGPPPPALADFSGVQFYFRPAEPGFLEVGSLAPEHADDVDPDAPVEGARPTTLRAYEQALARRLRGAAGGHWRGAWTGIYDVTPDWEPVIDRVPGTENTYVAAGFSGHGFKLAPAVGVTVAELVLDGRASTFDVSLLAADRFERGALVGARYGYSVLG
jgi:glycine/D-amino acid oxidase-like deaminating enzyme